MLLKVIYKLIKRGKWRVGSPEHRNNPPPLPPSISINLYALDDIYLSMPVLLLLQLSV